MKESGWGEDMSGLDISPLATACLSCGCRLETAITKTLSYYHHCLMSKLACLFTIFNLVLFKHYQTQTGTTSIGLSFYQVQGKDSLYFVKWKGKTVLMFLSSTAEQHKMFIWAAVPLKLVHMKILVCTAQSSLLSSSPDICCHSVSTAD